MSDSEQTLQAPDGEPVTYETAFDDGKDAGYEDGVEAERARIVAWLERSPLCTCPGHALCSCGHRAPHNLIQALRRGADHGWRNHSVSPHQCYGHEDMAHAEAQAFQEGYLCALWDTAAGQELHLTGVTL